MQKISTPNNTLLSPGAFQATLEEQISSLTNEKETLTQQLEEARKLNGGSGGDSARNSTISADTADGSLLNKDTYSSQEVNEMLNSANVKAQNNLKETLDQWKGKFKEKYEDLNIKHEELNTQCETLKVERDQALNNSNANSLPATAVLEAENAKLTQQIRQLEQQLKLQATASTVASNSNAGFLSPAVSMSSKGSQPDEEGKKKEMVLYFFWARIFFSIFLVSVS